MVIKAIIIIFIVAMITWAVWPLVNLIDRKITDKDLIAAVEEVYEEGGVTEDQRDAFIWHLRNRGKR